MPDQSPQHHTHPSQKLTSLRILQINLNKSEKAHLELINNIKAKDWDIVLVQEPHIIGHFNTIRTPTNFRPVFPDDRGRNDKHIRSLIWVSTALGTRHWKIIGVPGSNDITAIQLSGEYGKLTIINVYNECSSPRVELALSAFLRRNAGDLLTENSNMLWAGDFNRHHPLWNRDEDVHLFTTQALASAGRLISILADYDMVMPLPKGIPMLEHMVTKKFSRPDNVFCTPDLQDCITKCEVNKKLRPPCTDHFPIVTHLTLAQSLSPSSHNFNFRDTDWEIFRKELKKNITLIPPPLSHHFRITTHKSGGRPHQFTEGNHRILRQTEQATARRKKMVEQRP